MECLLELFQISRDHPVAVVLGASIRLTQGQPDGAKELIRLAIRSNPASPYLHEWAALCYDLCGDSRMARIFQDQAGLLRKYRSAVMTDADMERLDPMAYLYQRLFPRGVDEVALAK